MPVTGGVTRNDYIAIFQQVEFDYTFEILQASDLKVMKDGVLLSLNADYSITGVGNANGGTITLSALPAGGEKIALFLAMALDRTTQYQNAGDFLAADVNNDFDSLWIAANQQQTAITRSITLADSEPTSDLSLPLKDDRKGAVLAFDETTGLPVAGPTIADVDSVAGITGDIAAVADNEANIDTVAGISSDVTTVSGISENVTTVAGNTSNINTVAADAADIGAVASNIANVNTTAGISSDITTVAGNNANITIVAGDSTEITTVAGVASDVSTVAGISSEVTSVAGDSADIGTVASSISNVNAVGSNIGNVNSVASNTTNINTVAADGADIGAVANISTDVSTVADISSDVTTVAGLEPKIDIVIADAADIGTVAGISNNVSTVANISSDVTTVAGLETKMDTVIADAADIGSVASNISSVNTVAGISGDVITVAAKEDDIETVANNIAAVQSAGLNASNAALSAQAASNSEANAATSASNASSSANQAFSSATSADESEANAANSASASAASASISQSSAAASSNSASSASSSQASASSSASSASASASAAAISEDNAATSETNAANSATTATNIIAELVDLDSAVTNAAGSATSAATSASAALGYRNEAETHKNNAYTYSQSAASAVAYQDLTAIAESKSVTARDVFVYDTSKDSDGGAWRHRTQGTSWYNETLNTTTRGATKKFPAVAVIIAYNGSGNGGGVDIYDATDPDCPLWMRFQGDYSYSGGKMLALAGRTGNAEITSVIMKDAKLLVASNDQAATASGLHEIDFIKERCKLRTANNSSYNVLTNHVNIAARNADAGITSSSNTHTGLTSPNVNDVAMTVLPNAPIDPDTGLPVPTIAVATEGGVSVIKDDGSVDSFWDNHGGITVVTEVTWHDTDIAWFTGFGASTSAYKYNISPYTASGQRPVTERLYQSATNLTVPHISSGLDNTYIKASVATGIRKAALGTDNDGITLLDENPTTPTEGSVAYITTDYNTGWMNGDIKLATLSDTDDTNVTGSELVTNGDFATSSDWTIDGGSTGWSITGGVLQGSSATGNVTQDITTVVGEKYVISFKISGYSGTGDVYVRPGIDAGVGDYVEGDGSYSGSFTATSTTTILVIRGRPSQPFTGNIDNVSVRLAEEDRSVNGNGLQVIGTVTKSAVATGADLVGYSGFNNTGNSLIQPYNSDLDFGTGDFNVMSWVKCTNLGDLRIIASRYADDGADPDWSLRKLADDSFGFSGNNGSVIVSGGSATANKWHHVCVTRRNGVLYLYVDGYLVASATHTTDLTNTSAPLYVGSLNRNVSVYYGWFGSLSLTRISATAPTASQIAKIYRDEKPLFQENAKATLYGSSDAVTALAYDDDTELLHAGTSAGRSVFKGLQRASNTTDAIGKAISASNDLVVEE